MAEGQGAKITAGGVLDASAHAGHAGQIQLYGQTVAVTGDLLRAAGAGNGGRITLSGRQLSLADASQVDTQSAPGRTGWLTLESNRITVAPDAAAGQTRVSAAALARHLGRNNVSLASMQADLQVNEAVAWNNDTRCACPPATTSCWRQASRPKDAAPAWRWHMARTPTIAWART